MLLCYEHKADEICLLFQRERSTLHLLPHSANIPQAQHTAGLLEAVCKVAWPISTVYPEGCRYDTLCQISIGQEEVEEVIQRDISRTFPEHPQFSFEQGQQELFRVLKAYSLHDLQVLLVCHPEDQSMLGYCQATVFDHQSRPQDLIPCLRFELCTTCTL